MPIQARPAIEFVNLVSPIIVAIVFIAATSLLKEPSRRNFMAIMIAGAGAAYLNGGLGKWEFTFTAVVTYCAYKGLHSYRFIGVGWLLHTAWDVVHHLYGTPIVPFVNTSSLGCAICDPIIAAWCFAGAPSLYDVLRRKNHYTS
jgi:hypothetical protein